MTGREEAELVPPRSDGAPIADLGPGPVDVVSGLPEAHRLDQPTQEEPAPDSGGLAQQAASGVLWMTAQKWAVRLSGLATVAILTRVLRPEDFGVVAAAASIIPFVNLLSDLGFSTYIVQAEKPDNRVLSTGFWFSVVAGSVLSVGLILIAPLLGELFRLPEVVPVLRAMVASIALVSLSSVPIALLRRRMAFRALAVQSTIAAVVAQVAAIALTLAGTGVWALVAQLVTAQAITCTLAWWAARWHPTRHFSRSEFVEMAHFGSRVVAVEVVALARSWGETAIIAASLGASGLGYLNIAQRLVQVTQDLSAVALVPVSTVVFAKVRESADRLRAAYLRALRVSYAAVAPLMTFVAVAAPLLVPLLFGDGWARSIPVTQALAVAGILTLGAMLDNGLFYGTGRPGQWFAYAFAIDALTVATTAYSVRYGLIGVGVGFIGVAFIATIFRWALVGRLVQAGFWTVASPFGSIMVAAVLSAAAGLGMLSLTTGLVPVVALALTGIAVVVVHVVAVRIVMPRAFADVVALIPRRFLPSRLRT